MNKYNSRQKYGMGWFNESQRHSLARQGVKTGHKVNYAEQARWDWSKPETFHKYGSKWTKAFGNEYPYNEHTEQLARTFFIKRFGRDPDHPVERSYFDEWRHRFYSGHPTTYMDNESEGVYTKILSGDTKLPEGWKGKGGQCISIVQVKDYSKKSVRTVADLANRGDLQLVTDSQDVNAIKERIGKEAEDFDGFFVKVSDGDYKEVYGFEGNIPYTNKSVKRLDYSKAPEEEYRTKIKKDMIPDPYDLPTDLLPKKVIDNEVERRKKYKVDKFVPDIDEIYSSGKFVGKIIKNGGEFEVIEDWKYDGKVYSIGRNYKKGESILLNVSRKNYSKAPEGFVFVDWKDSNGKLWKDNIPKSHLSTFEKNIINSGGIVKKIDYLKPEVKGQQLRIRMLNPKRFTTFKTKDVGEKGKLQLLLGHSKKEGWKTQSYRLNLSDYKSFDSFKRDLMKIKISPQKREQSLRQALKYYNKRSK